MKSEHDLQTELGYGRNLGRGEERELRTVAKRQRSNQPSIAEWLSYLYKNQKS